MKENFNKKVSGIPYVVIISCIIDKVVIINY